MHVILGVTGGIAAYKAAELARLFLQNGHEVQAVLTDSAREFIQPLTFAALTGRKVITSMFSDTSPEATLSSSVEHIGVAEDNDLLVVAPATANALAKFAHGIADDFLSTLYLAFSKPVVLAPAMNNNMWRHAATEENIRILRDRGHVIVDPENGFLACGTYGPGRLAEPASILAAAEAVFSPNRDLQGEVVLVTAGPTREPIDPVRYLSNRSSGKMGYAIAQAAVNRGAKVTLVSGPVNLQAPRGATLIPVTTAAEMRDAVLQNLGPATVIVKCAAVADFRPSSESMQKIKKSSAGMTLELEPTSDILSELGRRKGDRLLIGFAAETQNLLEEARRKLETKNCDMVVANLVGDGNIGFESDENQVLLAMNTGEVVEIPRAPKSEIANKILNQIALLKRARIETR